MFYAADDRAVRAFHATAMKFGGQDEGVLGPREYHPDYYGAYVRDLEGNKPNISVSVEETQGAN